MTIDYVVPMVFPLDKEWRISLFNARSSDLPEFYYPENYVRYRSWETEELLIRLVKKNMPWLRNIYIILAMESQVQDWMGELGVRVVFHKDFIPEDFLPTFNSRAIEMFLKDIPDLSEYFLYGNDDMFPLSPLREEDFFVDGLPCLRFTEKIFPVWPNQFQRACLCGMNFVAKEFGKEFHDKWYKNGHSIVPMLKSTCEHLWERADEIRGSVTPFRTEKNFNQYIYSWWHFFSGKYIDKAPDRRYVGVKKTVEEVVAAIRDGGIVCVNDNECETDYMRYGIAVKEALSERLHDD